MRRSLRSRRNPYGLYGYLFAASLASGSSGAESSAAPAHTAMQGTQYLPAKTLVTRYCGNCHTLGGKHATRRRAHLVQALDRYEDWYMSQKVIRAVIDKWHLDGKIMPPSAETTQPSDAERRLLLAWLDRDSPNTKTGR